MPTTLYHMLRRVSSPTAELISLAEAKLYLRVDHAEDDVLISEMIVAVRCFAETMLARAIISQQWTVEYVDTVPCDLRLPMPPVQSILSVSLRDDAGVTTTLSSSNYHLLSGSLLRFTSPPSAALITVVYEAGDVNDTPRDIRHAMLVHLGMCYDMRSSDAPLPTQARDIYLTHREIRL
jgi:uncharacterized phiE125 gp8 family phage protein